MAATHLFGVTPDGKVVEYVEISSVAGVPGDNSISNAKLADVATATIKGRATAGTGDPEDLTPAQARTVMDVPSTAQAYDRANHTGTQTAATISDLTEVAQDLMSTTLVAGTNVTLTYNDVAGTLTIAAATGAPGADSVDNLLLANMAEATIKGRATAGTGDPEDLTAAQVRSIINVADGATANSADAVLLNRANHTGTQDVATVTGLDEKIDDRVAALLVAGANITLTYDDVANTLTVDASAAASGNFIPSGAGAVTRPMNTRMQEVGVFVTDYYNAGTDGSDYSPALTRAFAYNTRVYWPTGTYTMNTAVDIPNNAELIGAMSFSDDVGGVKITANAGWLNNNYGAATGADRRKRVHVSGFSVNGNNTAGVVCIKGPFGGLFEKVRIEDYDIGIENASAFLCDYDLLKFEGDGNIALSLADVNGTSITRCHFDATWLKHISTKDVVPMTGSSSGNGTGLYMWRNNHNASGNVATGNSLITVEGNLIMMTNYFEAYPAATNWQGVFVDLTANAFGNWGHTIINNEFNGGGADGALMAIRYNASRTSGSGGAYFPGRVEGNRFNGFDPATRPAIGTGANNSIHGVYVRGNAPENTNVISGLYARSIERPVGASSSTSSTSIAGATYITLPISTTQTIDNSDAIASNTFTVRKAGMYLLSTTVQLQATSADSPDVDIAFFNNGVETASVKTSMDWLSGTTYNSAHLTIVRDLAVGDAITVRGRGGTATASKVYFNAVYLGNGHY